jgi:hypothetical protein
MSWGSTAYTPIIAYNEPPFGFAETITPPDFRTNNEDPWSSTDELKAELSARFSQFEKARAAAAENFECAPLPLDSGAGARKNIRHELTNWLFVLLATVVFYFVLNRYGDGDLTSNTSVMFQAIYWIAVYLFVRRLYA